MKQEHYIHKRTGVKVIKCPFPHAIRFYMATNEGKIDDKSVEGDCIPDWVVEDSNDWYKMPAVKIFVRTNDGVDKYLNDKVYCYNETERTIKIYRINHGFETHVGVQYFHTLENATLHAESVEPRYSTNDVFEVAFKFFLQEQPSHIIGQAGAKNSALRLREEFKKIKQFK